MKVSIEPSEEQLIVDQIEKGGVASPQGFRASGLHAGFKKKHDLLDLALICADAPCSTAAVFTKNVFCAAPITVSKEHLDGVSYGRAQAIVVNSGNANAATGKPGLEAAYDTATEAARIIGCKTDEVVVASTGVIGVPLPFELFEQHLPQLVSSASDQGGNDAAQAIMTTDTVPKEYAIRYKSRDPEYAGIEFTIGGMAKGSGMIMPDMATLIAVLTTDAPLAPELTRSALVSAVGKSFNKVTIDSDTSTNDTCFLMASGQACADQGTIQGFAEGSIAYAEFLSALEAVCIELARKIAADGEGATKLITVKVTGARNDADADAAARAIANSPLVKTAIFGHDANWGRVAMAIGKSGAQFKQEDVSIVFMGLPVCKDGLPLVFDEEEALRRFVEPEIDIEVDLGAGIAQTTMWTCDFSHDYVTINGDYRT